MQVANSTHERSAAVMKQSKAVRPSVVIAVGVCALLAVGILAKHFGGFQSQLPEGPPQQLGSHGGAPSGAHARKPVSEHGGWIAQEGDAGSETAAGNRTSSSRAPAGSRPAAAPAVAAGSGSAEAGSTGSRAGGAAVVRSGAGSSAGAVGGHEANQAAGATGSTASPAGAEPIRADSAVPFQAPIPAGMGVQGAGSLAGAGNVPSVARNGAPGSDAPPAAADPSSAPADLAQPPGGDPIVNLTSDQRDFSAEQMFRVVPGPLVGSDQGALSFRLQPQWQAGDGSNATLVNLDNLDAGNTQQNRFEIFKDGQALHFALTDNSGAQIDISAAIDGWQPGEQHLVTATWGRGPDGKSQVSFYVDGKLAGQQPLNGMFAVQPGAQLSIGSNYGDGQTVPGVLSSFNMYKRSLTPAELGQAPAVPSK